jgi:hypothetical protein
MMFGLRYVCLQQLHACRACLGLLLLLMVLQASGVTLWLLRLSALGVGFSLT